jgi:hypothetical protein
VSGRGRDLKFVSGRGECVRVNYKSNDVVTDFSLLFIMKR